MENKIQLIQKIITEKKDIQNIIRIKKNRK